MCSKPGPLASGLRRKPSKCFTDRLGPQRLSSADDDREEDDDVEEDDDNDYDH